jgi:hypothetical protein
MQIGDANWKEQMSKLRLIITGLFTASGEVLLKVFESILEGHDDDEEDKKECCHRKSTSYKNNYITATEDIQDLQHAILKLLVKKLEELGWSSINLRTNDFYHYQ